MSRIVSVIPRAARSKLGLAGFITTTDNPVSLLHALRTAVAAVVSLLIARLGRLPEAHWAPISTIVVMQSTLGTSLPISVQRFGGTALGALIAALIGARFAGNAIAFGVLLFFIGIFCLSLRIERSAYRYAGITLAIVMLVPRVTDGWTLALHRFAEVSIGIAVGLAVSALWPERGMRSGLDGEKAFDLLGQPGEEAHNHPAVRRYQDGPISPSAGAGALQQEQP